MTCVISIILTLQYTFGVVRYNKLKTGDDAAVKGRSEVDPLNEVLWRLHDCFSFLNISCPPIMKSTHELAYCVRQPFCVII